MRKILSLLALPVLAVSGGIVSAGTGTSAGAGATTTPVVPLFQTIELPSYADSKGDANVYVVHGLNLDGQDAQDDGGNSVTVCVGESPLIGELEFGDVAGPFALTIGSTQTINVHLGADVPCDTTDAPLISQDVEIPDVASVSLVATSGPDSFDPELVPFELNTGPANGCIIAEGNTTLGDLAPQGRWYLGHAAAVGVVDVLLDDLSLDLISYSQFLEEDVNSGTLNLSVELDGTPIVGPTDLTIDPCDMLAVYMVGNQPVDVPDPTTTAPGATTTAAAAAAAVVPRFAG